ncbi:MAG TPA: serine protease, partial [Leptospiraceae bacterium]|nr:serine protease [Leptospiraceae bacterium]
GVIVSEIIPYSSADGVLETEDVITEFGGRKIDSQGFFQHPEYGKVQLSFLAHSGDEFGFKKGRKLPVKILRDRKEMTVNLVLKSFPYKSIRIPYLHNFGKHPSYLIRGGFVFTELSELLLREWGQNWRSRVDKKLLYYMDYKKHHETRESHGKVVILVQVLPDESNNGYHSLSMDIVTLAGDMKVSSIKELDTVISRTETPYIPIQLDNGVTIVLDKAGLKQTDENISKKFHIPVLSNIQ